MRAVLPRAQSHGASDLDELFEDMFAEHTAEEVEKLKARYATSGAVLEAP